MSEYYASQFTRSMFSMTMSGRQKVFIAFLILLVAVGVWYFSPQKKCEREARMQVYEAAAVADFNSIEEPYKSMLTGMIEDETAKCLQELRKQ